MAERRTLDRLLSQSGLCSRGEAARWIAAGRVCVDGRTVRSPDTWVDPRRDELRLDGRPLRTARPLHLVLHKPKGFLTSLGDPRGRRTVYDLLADVSAWVFPVGRLDRDTSGLLLCTNDTELGERVTNPQHGLEKLYRVTTKARIGADDLARLRAGIELPDGKTRPARARLVGHRGPTSVVEIALTEGRNRQVRRMFLAIGHPVKELRRIAIGPLELGGLASGRWRALTASELKALRARVLLPPASQHTSGSRPRRST